MSNSFKVVLIGQDGTTQASTTNPVPTAAQASGGTSTVTGNVTAADGGSLTSALRAESITKVYNGATEDLARSAVNATNSTGTGIQAVGIVAQLDDTSPTAITENQFGNLRMSSDRALLTSQHAYTSDQTAITNASGNVANANAVATLAAVAGKTTYITGFQLCAAGATAAAVVSATVAGVITGTMTYTFVFPAGATVAASNLIVSFNPPVPASAANTTIVVTLPAGGAGNTNATAAAQGFQQ